MLTASTRVPLPFLVRPPLVAAPPPEKVRVVPAEETSITLVVPFESVKLRSVAPVEPVYCKVPPPRTRLPAIFVELPSAPATPPLVIVAMLSVPALMVVEPVYVLSAERVSVPVPFLVIFLLPERVPLMTRSCPAPKTKALLLFRAMFKLIVSVRLIPPTAIAVVTMSVPVFVTELPLSVKLPVLPIVPSLVKAKALTVVPAAK